MKETRITPPKGCEIEKVEIVDGVAVVTFIKKERKLPKSWEEFCEMFPIMKEECYIKSLDSSIVFNRMAYSTLPIERSAVFDKNVLPDRATAEAIIALCQLIQLRDCYNGDWVPDWSEDKVKSTIEVIEGSVRGTFGQSFGTLFYFETNELRDKFLRNFSTLIEKIKPLYGIKEGGEK